MKPTRNKLPARKTPARTTSREPVEVYCRLRPLENDNEESCVKIINSSTIQLTPPYHSVAFRNGSAKETQHTFKYVFDENASQKECFDQVAKPLVEDLLKAKNGLLFTYGITGSGKTYTMQGTPQDGGIMSRSIDVIFNSILDFQAKKFVFKPDNMNGFDPQTEADAMLDRQNNFQHGIAISRPPCVKTPRRRDKDSGHDASQRVRDTSKIESIEEDNVFSVFITYIEIYNNFVYDLLEDTAVDTMKPKQLQSRILREDANRNMYVHGCTEVEVKCPEEVFEVFYKGQRRRKVAHTTLNTESSRSHSVFNIRLVQAPLDLQGEEVLQDKNACTISQLSLVDLAGSERTNRTRNTGDRLREAGNINNSLMTLRTCIEILKENQTQGTNKIVPYRDSKLTHLFKNYFDCEGKVKMIVCVNPRADDYDETIHVMKFAELTQEVQVARSNDLRFDLGLTPGRRRANQVYKEALKRLEEDGTDTRGIPVDIAPVYSLGPCFPSLELKQSDNEELILSLMRFLERRITTRTTLCEDLKAKQDNFRARISELEREITLKTADNSRLSVLLEQQKQKMHTLESRLVSAEVANNSLQQKLGAFEEIKTILEQELDEKEMQVNQGQIETRKVKAKMQARFISEREKITREMHQKIRNQKAQLKNQMWLKDEKLRTLKQIINDESTPVSVTPVKGNIRPANSETSLSTPSQFPHGIKATPSEPKLDTPDTGKKSIAVSNPRHRRSRSAGADTWLDHCPVQPVELSTVLQPQMKKRKSVTKLTEIKDVVNTKTSKYCLTTQEQDTVGDIETKLYKADILPTAGGGAQVVFNDVEILRQQSPTSATKRSADGFPKSNGDLQGIENKCAIAMESHGLHCGNKRPRH